MFNLTALFELLTISIQRCFCCCEGDKLNFSYLQASVASRRDEKIKKQYSSSSLKKSNLLDMMTFEELQGPPYNFSNYLEGLQPPISSSQCFVGTMEAFQLIHDPVVGIFLSIPKYELPNQANITFIKTFKYSAPKYEFKLEDCPEATHVLITDDFSDSAEGYKDFLQRLTISDINNRMINPAVNPYLEK